ncbi:hypothetical protein K438DRAFT_1765740 [Mycena galopus ATCC 62051]|nr:hypothetical protein K438DRAFT_1765740 [Mycena galopus ATCC 62051]
MEPSVVEHLKFIDLLPGQLGPKHAQSVPLTPGLDFPLQVTAAIQTMGSAAHEDQDQTPSDGEKQVDTFYLNAEEKKAVQLWASGHGVSENAFNKLIKKLKPVYMSEHAQYCCPEASPEPAQRREWWTETTRYYHAILSVLRERNVHAQIAHARSMLTPTYNGISQ